MRQVWMCVGVGVRVGVGVGVIVRVAIEIGAWRYTGMIMCGVPIIASKDSATAPIVLSSAVREAEVCA